MGNEIHSTCFSCLIDRFAFVCCSIRDDFPCFFSCSGASAGQHCHMVLNFLEIEILTIRMDEGCCCLMGLVNRCVCTQGGCAGAGNRIYFRTSKFVCAGIGTDVGGLLQT